MALQNVPKSSWKKPAIILGDKLTQDPAKVRLQRRALLNTTLIVFGNYDE
jgi:hypothetical protein